MGKNKNQDRRCLICRKRRPAAEQLRLLPPAAGDELVLDLKGKLQGRSAVVCLDGGCLDKLSAESLGAALDFELSDQAVATLPTRLRSALEQRLLSLLGIAQRGGKLVSGSEASRAAIKRARPNSGWLALVAADASSEIARKLCQLAESLDVAHARVLTAGDLGGCIGKSPRSAVVITDTGLSYAAWEIVARLDAVTTPAAPDEPRP